MDEPVVLAPVAELRRIRLVSSVTQDNTEVALGLHRRSDQVWRWEKGRVKPSLPSLCRWANALGRQAILDPYGMPDWWARAESGPHRRPYTLMTTMRYLRMGQRLSQTRVGDVIGAHKSRISRWETGQEFPTLVSFIRWADFFGQELAFVPLGLGAAAVKSFREGVGNVE